MKGAGKPKQMKAAIVAGYMQHIIGALMNAVLGGAKDGQHLGPFRQHKQAIKWGRRSKSVYRPHQGERECARRRKQANRRPK